MLTPEQLMQKSSHRGNAKMVERNTIGPLMEAGIVLAMRKIWKESKSELSFEEWLKTDKK